MLKMPFFRACGCLSLSAYLLLSIIALSAEQLVVPMRYVSQIVMWFLLFGMFCFFLLDVFEEKGFFKKNSVVKKSTKLDPTDEIIQAVQNDLNIYRHDFIDLHVRHECSQRIKKAYARYDIPSFLIELEENEEKEFKNS